MQRTNKILVATVVILALMLVITNLDVTGDLRGMITGKYDTEVITETVNVDLFAMSMCPHCVEFESVLNSVIGQLDENIRFRIFYVLTRDQDGVLQSPRGDQEIEEDTRQLCISKHYPGSFMGYVACIGEHYQNPNDAWETCASSNGIDPEVIEGCWMGEEGEALLEENVKKADYMGITRSPILMINKRFYTGKRTPNAVKDWICDEFENPPEGCAVDLEGTGITGLIIGTPSEEFCSLE